MAASSSLRMVRRPWLRRTRLLAGAPTASGSGVAMPATPLAGPDGPAGPADFLVAGDRSSFFGAGAGSWWTLGGPMPGAW